MFDDGSTLSTNGMTEAAVSATTGIVYETKTSIVGGTGSFVGTYGELSTACTSPSAVPCVTEGIICQTKQGKTIAEDM